MSGDRDTADVVAHYEAEHEEDRLVGGFAELELVRTQDILRRHLSAPPATIADVGGGTGVHAEWLLDDGYAVHLIDLAPRHVDRALATLGDRGLTAEVGDARDLPLADHSVDVVLLLGPLYHLHDLDDRLAVLREARRVVRHGGLVAVAAISRFASLFDGLARRFLFDPEFRAIVENDLVDGRHRNPGNRPHWFTTAYFHHPADLAEEMVTAGFMGAELFGIEGLAGWLTGLGDHWADENDRAVVLDAIRRVESEPTLIGVSAHLLALGRTPE